MKINSFRAYIFYDNLGCTMRKITYHKKHSSIIQTLTVGTGITPVQSLKKGVADYHRRWGLSPRPEELYYFVVTKVTKPFN